MGAFRMKAQITYTFNERELEQFVAMAKKYRLKTKYKDGHYVAYSTEANWNVLMGSFTNKPNHKTKGGFLMVSYENSPNNVTNLSLVN